MKYPILIFSTLILSLLRLSAQEIEWQNTIGGDSIDIAWSITQTFDGGFVVSGFSASNISGDKTENNLGGFDYWILKLDHDGNLLWQNTIGGSGNDIVYSIQQTPDSGYICIGKSDSNISGDKSENSQGGFDYWVLKLDANGNIVWQNTIGGNDDDGSCSIMQTTDGGYICGGSSKSDASGDKTEMNFGEWDYWILKLNSAGNIQWQNTIGGSKNDVLKNIQQTTDGGYICGGWSDSNISGDKNESSNGYYDYWIVKLDPNGAIQWQNTIGGSSYDELSSIRQTDDGGYICGGMTQSNISGDKTENSQGGVDYWILKLNSIGNIQWQNNIGGSSSDWLFMVEQSVDGSYVCAGSSQSGISGDKTEPNLTTDFWLINLDTNGNIQWQNTIGGGGLDELLYVNNTNDGNFILAGYSNSDISGDKTENCIGYEDVWIVKLTGSYNLIKGVTYADFNANNIKDANEPALPNKKIIEINSGRFAFTDNNGAYSVSTLDSGNFTVQPVSINYYSAVPGNHNVTFNSMLQIDTLNDFALQPIGSVNDLCIFLSPTGLFRAGMNATYMINYFNYGNTTLSPIIIFYPDSNVSFMYANPIANTITPDSIIFVLNPINPFQNGQIYITVGVDLGLPIGTLINSGAVILPIIGDANPDCNTSYWEVLTTGSMDPNDILVSRSKIFDYELTNSPWLEYIIRFQNTGNDTAFYVNVVNKMGSGVELGSFEMLSSSHLCNLEFQFYDSTMKFIFNNILLPDSNINEPESHGFVRYRIKPKNTLMAGDSILNNARITFDYNSPISTNTAITEIINNTGIMDNTQSAAVLIYPNPVENKIILEQNVNLRQRLIIELFNIYGQRILLLYDGIVNPGKWNQQFDINDLQSGVYLITVKGIESTAQRIIKL